MMVKPSIPKQQYIPEVIYKLKDEYGNTVQRIADPLFPIEYLLLTLSHGFPVSPDPFFKSPLAFPALNENSAMANFKMYTKQAEELPMHVSLSNFNLLQFIASQHLLTSAELDQLCKALINRDEVELHNFTLNSGSWATLMTVAAESDQRNASAGDAIGRDWTCPHCTFINVDRTEDSCEMCGLPV
jgi:nuclear protein localization family protein 4